MKTSKQGLELLADREAFRNEAYLDSKGIPTIGVGHTGPEVHLGLVWTDEQVQEALQKDVKLCEDTINLYCVQALAQHQFDALVSFAFNVGVNAFRRSTMLRKLNQGDYEGAANEFNRWIIPTEVTSRRKGEKHQFRGTKFVARAKSW
jgi:lysozyme